ncbi:MAG: hypothetical protein DWQ37_07015 [Planctomycetota bacterium]|nr:MAG: hypothetical protein DWQ37_07015 [Planctomycetota bacterium]
MDQVKVVLGYVQKYHFWLLCVVVIVAGLVGWMKASGSLSQEYQTHKGTVTGKYDSLVGILNGETPPNADWTASLAELTQQEREKVRAAWQAVYDDQQKVLDWPIDVMGDEFAQRIADAKPGSEIPQNDRAFYQNNVINNEFPRLREIVEAPAPDAMTGRSDGDDQSRMAQYKVVWDSESQDDVREMLAMTGSVPTSQAVWQRQEDLWVFKALLNIIRKTNEGTQYNSRVKIIEELSIGKEAAEKFAEGKAPGHIETLANAAPSGAAMTPPAPPPDPTIERPLDENRYLDADGNPLPTLPPGEQYKRMPVFMKLVMDQREIGRLLAECANYPLPVEVHQFRLNPKSKQEKSKRSSQSSTGAAQARMGPPAAVPDAYDVTVEISGIIYIFNPPDMEKLGVPADGAQLAGR